MEKVNRSLNPAQRLQIYRARLGDALSSEDQFTNLRGLIKRKLTHVRSQLRRSRGRDASPPAGATLEEVNTVAGANFYPKLYPGTLTIFRSTTRRVEEGNDESLGWGGLAKDVQIHHIASNHLNILQEPSVKLLSEKLKYCLDQLADATSETVLQRLHL